MIEKASSRNVEEILDGPLAPHWWRSECCWSSRLLGCLSQRRRSGAA